MRRLACAVGACIHNGNRRPHLEVFHAPTHQLRRLTVLAPHPPFPTHTVIACCFAKIPLVLASLCSPSTALNGGATRKRLRKGAAAQGQQNQNPAAPHTLTASTYMPSALPIDIRYPNIPRTFARGAYEPRVPKMLRWCSSSGREPLPPLLSLLRAPDSV